MTIEQATRELRAREPLFHRADFGTTRADFDRMIASDFHEIGASGRLYTRNFILDTLEERHRTPQYEDHLEVSGFTCHALCTDTFMVNYTLVQTGNRSTRRTTIWRYQAASWKAVFHQGTVASG